MAVRKQRVAFKDITPTEEKSPISSISLSLEEMGAVSKPIPPPKPKMRPKLTLDLSSIRRQPELFSSSDSVFEDNNICSELSFRRQNKPLPILKPILISQPRVKPVSPGIETLPDHLGESRTRQRQDRRKLSGTASMSSKRQPSFARKPNDVDNAYIQSLKTHQIDVSTQSSHMI